MRPHRSQRTEFPDGALRMALRPVIRRRVSLTFLRIAVGVLILAAAATPAVAQTARFTGRVTNMVDGEPIAGVTITLRNVDNGAVVQIESNDDGRYFRRSLPIGRFEITFEKEGYVSARDSRRLGSGRLRGWRSASDH